MSTRESVLSCTGEGTSCRTAFRIFFGSDRIKASPRDRITVPPLGNTTRLNDSRPLADIEWIDAWSISFVGT